jgi:Domain of unknown function (DUF4337)
MPEEIEVPTEHLQEKVHEAAEHEAHGGKHGAGHEASPFNMRVALTTALLAVIAAVAALMAGHAANEALLEEIEASNEWNHYQSKSIKASVLGSKVELLDGRGKPSSSKDAVKLAQYDEDMKELQEAARSKEEASAQHMKHHVTLARSVTFFQIAIALAAIAVLTKKSPLWLVSLALGAIGVAFFVAGLV